MIANYTDNYKPTYIYQDSTWINLLSNHLVCMNKMCKYLLIGRNKNNLIVGLILKCCQFSETYRIILAFGRLGKVCYLSSLDFCVLVHYLYVYIIIYIIWFLKFLKKIIIWLFLIFNTYFIFLMLLFLNISMIFSVLIHWFWHIEKCTQIR